MSFMLAEFASFWPSCSWVNFQKRLRAWKEEHQNRTEAKCCFTYLNSVDVQCTENYKGLTSPDCGL